MDNYTNTNKLEAELKKITKHIPHYTQKENIKLLNDRLGTIYYRDSPDLIFDAYFALYKRGLALEKAGRLEEALDFYYWILYMFYPIGTVYFERPAIICEKLKRYDEAILVTKMYVKVAESANAHMDLPAAQRRLNRLLTKKEKSINVSLR